LTITEMVLWDDTRIVPCDSQLWAYSAHGVATGTNNGLQGWEFT